MRPSPLAFAVMLLWACGAAPGDPPLGGLTCGTAVAPAADGPPPAYTTGPTGVAWLDASAVSSTRGDRRLWHLHAGAAPVPDPRHAIDPAAYPTATVDPDNCLTGQTVAAVYTAPGTYPVTCDVTRADGSTVTFGQTVVVPPDTRPHYYVGPTGDDANAGTDPAAPLASAAAFAKVVRKGGCRVTLLPGTTLTLPDSVHPGSGTTVDGQPDPSGNLPRVSAGGTWAFQVDGKTTAVLFRGLLFDAGPGVVQGNVRAVPSNPHARAEAVVSFGTDVVVDGCQFGCLTRAVEADAGDGFAVLRCRQVDPHALAGQGISLWGGCRACVAFDTLTECWAEAPFRVDGRGAGNGLTVEWNAFAQSDPTCADGAAKPAVDVRSCRGATIAHNAVVNAPLTFSDSHGQLSCRDVLVTGNAYRSTDGVHPQQFVVAKGAIVGLTVTGEDFGPSCKGAVAVSVSADPAQSDLSVPTAASTYAGGLKPLAVGGSAAALSTGATGK